MRNITHITLKIHVAVNHLLKAGFPSNARNVRDVTDLT